MIMKNLKNQFRLISLFFTILILLQSCRVYHRDSVSLQQAIKEEKRVKIKTVDNKILKFKRVIYEDGRYYGIKPSTFMYKIYKIPLDESYIRSIRMHNKTLSVIYGVGFTLVIILIGAYVLVMSAVERMPIY